MTMTYGQISSSLQAAISAAMPEDDGDGYIYIVDFSDTFVVYCANWDEYLQDDYSMDSDGNVKLAGKPEQVKSVTTYVPVEEQKALAESFERRGMVVGNRVSAAELRMDAKLKELSSERGWRTPKAEPVVTVNSEPLTYHRYGQHSFYRDLVQSDRNPGAMARIERHSAEMRVINGERERRAWSSVHGGDIEYRVEPNRTDGYGGYLSPPIWLNDMFATAVRPTRQLAGLMPKFDLPEGVSQVNIPIINTGTRVQHVTDTQSVPDVDFTDSAGSSGVVTIAGQADIALQLLEQSPVGASIDWSLFMDMAEDMDRDLETQLINGRGSNFNELLGVINADTTITYTSASPTATGLWAYFGQAAAQLGDGRLLPPECWIMRTARWSWISTAEDTAGRPFGLSSPFFIGSDEATPDPVGGLVSWPVFLSDATPATLGAGSNQDAIILLRPSDLPLFESAPLTAVMREPLSGSLGVRLQMHSRVAAITTRYPQGIYTIQGTGLVVQSGF